MRACLTKRVSSARAPRRRAPCLVFSWSLQNKIVCGAPFFRVFSRGIMSTTMAVKTLSSCIKQLKERGFVELSESGKKVTGLTNLSKRIQNNLNNVWDSSFLKQRPVVKLSSVATADPNQTLPDVSSSEVTSGSGFQFESNVPTISACEQDKLQSFFCVPLTHRKVVLCCSPETSFNFYNAIQRNRYQWWRKVSERNLEPQLLKRCPAC